MSNETYLWCVIAGLLMFLFDAAGWMYDKPTNVQRLWPQESVKTECGIYFNPNLILLPWEFLFLMELLAPSTEIWIELYVMLKFPCTNCTFVRITIKIVITLDLIVTLRQFLKLLTNSWKHKLNCSSTTNNIKKIKRNTKTKPKNDTFKVKVRN